MTVSLSSHCPEKPWIRRPNTFHSFSALIFLGLLLFFALYPMREATAEEGYNSIGKKQEEKRKTRWSLSEWLETKDRSMLMDLWLAVHSPSPYEFYISADYDLRYPAPEPITNMTGYRANFGAFASIFGLEVERDDIFSRWTLLFKLRLAGFHNQGTNLTVFGGLRVQSQPQQFLSEVVGASLVVYFTRFFGVETQYRYYTPANLAVSSFNFRGQHLELDGFIDFNFLRVYGGYLHYFDDFQNQVGYHIGTRIFF